MKVCNKCGTQKEFNEFYSNNQTRDGRGSSCKECVRARSAERRRRNPKPKKEREVRIEGFRLLPKGMRKCGECSKVKEKCLFYKDSSRASGVSNNCKECLNAYLKKRRRERSLELLEARRAWTERNRERLREQYKEYAGANRERLNITESRRRARKKGLPDTLTLEEMEKITKEFGGKCSICSEEYEHLDHFIPIATGCGGTTYENIVPMCASCNISKGAKNPFVWAKQLSEKERERFDGLVRYLSDINGIAAVEDYEAHVNNCFK